MPTETPEKIAAGKYRLAPTAPVGFFQVSSRAEENLQQGLWAGLDVRS